MNIVLSPIKLIKIRNELDRFGFSYILAERFQLGKPPISFASYIHGWIWQKDFKLVDVGHSFTPLNTPIIVATKLQKAVLEQYNFKNVIAGGLPFAYVGKSKVVKKFNSLLIMPPHSMKYLGYNGIDINLLNYVESIRYEFSEICFCLHIDDADDNEITNSLLSKGFIYIVGAHHGDKNSLKRMREIFDYFDYVTTTTMGSHILYAAFCGCKVSILQEYFLITPEHAFDQYSWRADFVEYKNSSLDGLNNKLKLNEQFPWLFLKHPKEAVQKVDWAIKEIGADNLLDKGQLMELLGWTARSKMRALMRTAMRHFSDLCRKSRL